MDWILITMVNGAWKQQVQKMCLRNLKRKQHKKFLTTHYKQSQVGDHRFDPHLFLNVWQLNRKKNKGESHRTCPIVFISLCTHVYFFIKVIAKGCSVLSAQNKWWFHKRIYCRFNRIKTFIHFILSFQRTAWESVRIVNEHQLNR